MEQIQSNVKQLVPPKKEVTLYCSQHQSKELDLYCETCGELICLHCTVKKHKDHQYDLVGDMFENHKAEITASLEPVEKQLGVVSKALEQFGIRSKELDDIQVVIEDSIQQQIQQLQELLEARKAQLINQLQQYIQTKKKSLAAQKDEVEAVHTQLVSCLSFVRESLRTGSQGEVMKMKKAVVKQIKEMTDNFKPDMLPPCELANVKFIASPDLTQACQQFGKLLLQNISPEKCYATGNGLEVAKVGEKATAVLHVVDQKEKACTTPVEALTCELVPEKIDCSVKKTETNQHEISYQATNQGRHQLHIKVEGEHIKGSPFPVIVKLPVKKLGIPIKTISGLKKPRGVAVNQRGDIIIAENDRNCLSIINHDLMGEKVHSGGVREGHFKCAQGVAVDHDGNIILTVSDTNHCVQKFTSTGNFIKEVGKKGTKAMEFNVPTGIAVHTLNKKIYIADQLNHRIQILNPDLTFSSSFGSAGSGNGQFCFPWGVAIDSTGSVYVADSDNNRIQVFTAEGQYLRQFGVRGSRRGYLNDPVGICIDSENAVYVVERCNRRVSVFTCEGEFLMLFGMEGTEPGQFDCPSGIAVDKYGVVYVCDTGNDRLQLF